jgi:aryl sulfotransferase
MDRDGYPLRSFWGNVRSWWEIRDLQNVLFVHFESLKRDMAAEMRRIEIFLDISVEDSRWEPILEYGSFDWMKQNTTKTVPLGGGFWDAGAQAFINKGVNGLWNDTLSTEDVAEYETRVVEELGEECAHWLRTGQGVV